MVSPLFRAYRGSKWREDVFRTWAFLQQNYEITKNKNCGTHIHISIRRGFSLADMKDIAQCIIHFEAAIEALVPEYRRGNSYMKSNWLDNSKLALRSKSPTSSNSRDRPRPKPTRSRRADVPSHCRQLLSMELHLLAAAPHDRIPQSQASTTAREALMWAEFAMSFILSAMQTDDVVKYLNTTPPNVAGLRRFLLQDKKEPHLCEPGYLKPLWAGKTGEESIPPMVCKTTDEGHRQLLEGEAAAREEEARSHAVEGRAGVHVGARTT